MKPGIRHGRPIDRRETRTCRAGLRSVLVAGVLAILQIPASPCPSQAQMEEMTISELSQSDLRKSLRQRELILTLVSRRLGQRISGKELADLRVLQRLLDQRHIKLDQVFEQQALGLVMGDIMVAQLGLHWVVIDDRVGHSRALRYKEMSDLFFPITMISKTLQFERSADVRGTYAIIEEKVKALKAKEGPALGNRSRRPPITASELKALREASM